MKTPFFISAILLTSICSASEDRIPQWGSVTIQTSKVDRGIKITARAKADRLSYLAISTHGSKQLVVPTSEFQGIDGIRLNSIQILFSERNPNSHYVRLNFGEPVWSDKDFESSYVEFLFISGKYQERLVHRLTGPGSWKLERNTPGKPAKETGTVSNVR